MRDLRLIAAIVCTGSILFAGCGKKKTVVAETEAGASASATDTEKADGTDSPAAGGRLHQPFADATRPAADPPEGTAIPVDQTMTGKSVGKLHGEVKKIWDSIRFTNAAGTRIEYAVTLDTDLGPITIDLNPEVVPNHCRNFIALARTGYYDGLCFDRLLHQEAEDDAATKLDLVEAGCPLGAGVAGIDHLGYWLRPEFDDDKNPKLPHDDGTVGAVHGEELDSAGVRFYITLGKAPFLDGKFTAFGKVTQGLEVARIIHQQPAIIDEQESGESRRPEKPVVIRKVTVQVRGEDETRK